MEAPTETNADLVLLNNHHNICTDNINSEDMKSSRSVKNSLHEVIVLNDTETSPEVAFTDEDKHGTISINHCEVVTVCDNSDPGSDMILEMTNDTEDMKSCRSVKNSLHEVIVLNDTETSPEVAFTDEDKNVTISTIHCKVGTACNYSDPDPDMILEMTNDTAVRTINNNVDSNPEDLVEITYDSLDQNNVVVEYDFKQIPHQITGSWKEFRSQSRNNFTRGCKWAPDGSCILTCSDDNILRIFNLPPQLWDSTQWHEINELEAVVKIFEGELIYDYCWYPLMNSSDPSTCCLVSASKSSTVHLWDGFTGELRCSYRAYNQMDEIVTPHSLGFNNDGQKLFCGFEKVVRVFNVDSPGRSFEERYLFAKKSGQSGIISCFAFNPIDQNLSAVGSYLKTIGIYSEPSGSLECLLEGQKGGITQLQFSPDGVLLYSGGRKDPEILCWDLRNLGTVLYSLRRSSDTNQRMYFDISRCGKYVVSGNQNGVVSIWDVTKEPKIISEEEFAVLEPIQYYMAHDDCVNGISLHPSYPLLCSSSGQRKFPSLLADEDEEMFSPKIDKFDNSLRLWWLGKMQP